MALRFMVGEIIRRKLPCNAGENAAMSVLNMVHEEPREVAKLQHLRLMAVSVHEWLCIVDGKDRAEVTRKELA